MTCAEASLSGMPFEYTSGQRAGGLARPPPKTAGPPVVAEVVDRPWQDHGTTRRRPRPDPYQARSPPGIDRVAATPRCGQAETRKLTLPSLPTDLPRSVDDHPPHEVRHVPLQLHVGNPGTAWFRGFPLR
jgi:hypothetical protein